jgi:hypothetical protein
MIDYLKAFELGANLFPGFEAEIQGLYREVDSFGKIRFFTYVVREQPAHGRRRKSRYRTVYCRPPSGDPDVGAMLSIYRYLIRSGVGRRPIAKKTLCSRTI